MRQNLLISVMFLALLAPSASGCSILTPGNEGWQCESSDECGEGLRCISYRFKGRSQVRSYCTGRKALNSNKQTYNWFLLVAAWAMIIGLPLLVVVAVVIGRIKARKQKQSGPGDGGQSPPQDSGQAAA